MNTMTMNSGTRLSPTGAAPRESSPGWARWVPLGSEGGTAHPSRWEYMVRARLDRIISMLEVYRRTLRPALSIKLAAMATETRRTTPTTTAATLKGVRQLFGLLALGEKRSAASKVG